MNPLSSSSIPLTFRALHTLGTGPVHSCVWVSLTQIAAAWGPLAQRPVTSRGRAELRLSGCSDRSAELRWDRPRMLMDTPESSRLKQHACTLAWLTAMNTSSSYTESWDLSFSGNNDTRARTRAQYKLTHTSSQFVLGKLLLKGSVLPNNRNKWCCGGWAHHKIFSMCCSLGWKHQFTPTHCKMDSSYHGIQSQHMCFLFSGQSGIETHF